MADCSTAGGGSSASESITRRNLHILRIAAEVGMGGGRRAVAVEPGGGADACAENMDTY